MANDLILIRKGPGLFPATPECQEALEAIPNGESVGARISRKRNLAFHNKAFSLLALAFDLWEPVTYLGAAERHTVRQLHDYLIRRGLSEDAVSGLTTDFLMMLDSKRQGTEFTKSKEAFREFVTVQAGFFDLVISPAGPRKVAKSWAFGQMSQEQFDAMYQAIFDVLWNLCLKQNFENPEAAEAAAQQLLNYA